MELKMYRWYNETFDFPTVFSSSPNYEINAMNSVNRLKTTNKRYE